MSHNSMKNTLSQHKSTLYRVLDYIGAYKWLVLLSLILAAVTVAATLYAPILVGNAVDLILGPGNVEFCRNHGHFKTACSGDFYHSAGSVGDEPYQQPDHVSCGKGYPYQGI